MKIFTLSVAVPVLSVLLSAQACAETQATRGGQLYPGQPASREYEIRGAEVLDKGSGLVWQRCSVGQSWVSGKGCEGNVEAFSFDDAQRLGFGPWRLPTQFEMAKLIDHGLAYEEQAPTTNVDAFPNMDRARLWYWTSTPDGPFVAWYVSFVDGRFSLDGRNFKYAVRLVRDNP